VKFCQAIQTLAPNTVIIEVGPSAGLLSQIKRMRKDLVLLATMRRTDGFNMEKFCDQLWLNDVSFKIKQVEGKLPLNEVRMCVCVCVCMCLCMSCGCVMCPVAGNKGFG